jgi:C1A family cysteine protease
MQFAFNSSSIINVSNTLEVSMQHSLLRGILIFVGFISLLIFPKTASQATELDLPTQYDWRNDGYDFPVHDQGNCNAGYAFAAVDAVQAAIWKKDKVKVDFSVNHAKECNWHALTHYAGLPLNTCEGGNFKMLTNLFTQEGLVLENCDPYVDYDDSCSTRCVEEDATECMPKCSTTYYIKEWQQFSPNFEIAPTDLIKQMLKEHGPLYSQMDPKISGFSSYDGGYVLSSTSTDPNKWTHGVLIVGWDDDLSYTGGKGAWIVKNSYGTEWGNDGYFNIAYGKAGIGSSLATVTGWERNSVFNKIHFYDEAGHTNQISTSEKDFFSGSAMALFPIKSNEIPQAVEFWTNDAATVSIELYELFDGIEPFNNLFQSAEIDIPYTGYHQFKINENLKIPGNREIAVVLNVKNKSYFYPIALDHLGPLSSDKTWYKNEFGVWKSLPTWQGQNYEGTIRLRSLIIPEGLNHKVFLPIVSKK